MLRSKWQLGTLFIVVVILCSWLAPLEKPALERVDAGLKRALITFASARALNAAISVAQGTEVSLSFGAGLTLTPGQVLDPVNDVVEQLSTLMLAASVAFGIQRLLITIGAYWLVSLFLSIVALGWLWQRFKQKAAPAWLSGLFAVLLMIRFVMPLVTIGSDLLFQRFLAEEYASSQKVIEAASGKLTQLDPADSLASKDRSWWEKIQGSLSDQIMGRYENLKRAAEQAIDNIVRVVVIFALQTVLIPLLLFWLLYMAATSAVGRPRSTT